MRNHHSLKTLFFWNVSLHVSMFSSVQSLDQFGCQGDMRDDSAEFLFQSFCKRSSWAILARAGMFTLWCCSSSISSADHSFTHPPGCLDGLFWGGCLDSFSCFHVKEAWQRKPPLLIQNCFCWICTVVLKRVVHSLEFITVYIYIYIKNAVLIFILFCSKDVGMVIFSICGYKL